MLATENQGYSDKDPSRLRRDFGPDFTLDDVTVRGLTPEEALERAATDTGRAEDVVTLAASLTPGRILQLPARKLSPNQATTSDTLSTAGATLRIHLQDMDIRAGQIHPKPDSPDAGTVHLGA